jgi:hypothetical protein
MLIGEGRTGLGSGDAGEKFIDAATRSLPLQF